MKRIKLTVFHQEDGSKDCGPVSMRMVFGYFQIDTTTEELVREMSYEDVGTYIYDNGLLALSRGLKTELVTANPLLFSREKLGELKRKDAPLVQYLDELSGKPSFKTKKRPLGLFKKYIEAGGQTCLEIPDVGHIHKAIDQGSPVLALLYGQALGSKEGGFHFVVVSGYKEGYVYINNPLREATQGWFRNQDFLYALHASTCADVDNGSLLIFKAPGSSAVNSK